MAYGRENLNKFIFSLRNGHTARFIIPCRLSVYTYSAKRYRIMKWAVFFHYFMGVFRIFHGGGARDIKSIFTLRVAQTFFGCPQYILLLRMLTVILARQFYSYLFIYIFLYKNNCRLKTRTILFYFSQT